MLVGARWSAPGRVREVAGAPRRVASRSQDLTKPRGGRDRGFVSGCSGCARLLRGYVLAPVDPAVVAPVDDVPDFVADDPFEARGVRGADDDAAGLVVGDRLVAARIAERDGGAGEDRVLGDVS